MALNGYIQETENTLIGNVVIGLKGPKGDKGDKGDQGEQGIQGIQGEQGIQGIQGEKGNKGDKGDEGDKGEQGIRGANGNGTVNETNITLDKGPATIDIVPNNYYKITTGVNFSSFLRLNLTGAEDGLLNEYSGEIRYNGTTFHYLSRDNNINWTVSNVDEQTQYYYMIKPNTTYIFNIVNGIGFLVGVEDD